MGVGTWVGFQSDGRILLGGSLADHPESGRTSLFNRRFWP